MKHETSMYYIEGEDLNVIPVVKDEITGIAETPTNDLWNRVCDSSKFGEISEIMKGVAYGDREFTAVDAYAQIKMATKLFGPFGAGWGIDSIKFITQFPVVKRTRKGNIEGYQAVFEVEVFYWWNGIRNRTVVLNDIFMDASGDSTKKLITNSLTKFLSYLGFNADVFLGRFNDNVYEAQASEADINTLKTLIGAIKNKEKASTMLTYHDTRGWIASEVQADIDKIHAAREKAERARRAVEATKGEEPAGEEPGLFGGEELEQ